jgi:hypothetical protein
MADTAQSTSPLYVKIQYGATSTANCFGIRLQIGTGHDGAGNLTNIMHDSGVAFFGQTVTNANAMTHYASGDSGRIWIHLAASGTSWAQTNTLGISIERRRNSSGVAQTTGFLSLRWGATTVATNGYLANSAAPMNGNAFYFPAVITNASDATLDSKVGVYPQLYPLGPSEMGLQIVGIIRVSYPVGTTFTCTVLGTTRTYMPTQIAAGVVTALAGATHISPAFLYE